VSRSGFPVVVAAPSGTGKTTVCRELVSRDAGLSFSVSHTTRRHRDGEVDGRDYHFVSQPDFEGLVDDEAFLEWAVYNGNRYGTSWQALEARLGEGLDVLLEIEVQGARQVRERRHDARLIFLLPPSSAALRERLIARGTDTAAEIDRRLEVARGELASAPDFDYAVVNDDLQRCVSTLQEILAAERGQQVRALRTVFNPADALDRLLERDVAAGDE
jgi:guanylate kinase